MDLNKTPILSVNEAAERFVLEVIRDSAVHWRSAKEALRPALRESLTANPDLLEDRQTGYFFALARVAMEMQAARNLLPDGTARAVVAAVGTQLKEVGDDDEVSADFVFRLDSDWGELLAEGHNPAWLVGFHLFKILALRETADIDGTPQPNPTTIMAVQEAVVRQVGSGWWKAFLASHRVAAPPASHRINRPNDSLSVETRREIAELVHHLWGKAGTREYDKAQWTRLQTLLRDVGIDLERKNGAP